MVTIDKNNNCKIIVENCAPYEVTHDDIFGLIELEEEELNPITDEMISSVCNILSVQKNIIWKLIKKHF